MSNFNKLFWVGLIPLYFITRLVNLKIIPIFTDEAIYTYWAQVALHDPQNRFISLEDGKQPLFIWAAAIFQNFVTDPLIATRLVATAAGLGSLVGIYLLAKELFNSKVAKIAALLYLILPFTLLYDRLALFDSLLTMLGIYVVLLCVKLARHLQLDLALLAGAAMGLALITKSSANFFLFYLPFSLIFFDFKNKNVKPNLIRWLFFATVAIVLSQIIYNALRLSPLFYIIANKNLEFIRPVADAIADPFAAFSQNITVLISWLTTYMGLPLFAIFIFGVFYGIKKRNLRIIYLLVLVAMPFFAETVFNKVLYPRFMLFYFPYIILILSFAINELFELFPKYKKYLIVGFAAAMLFPTMTSFFLLTNPPKAKIAASDAGQYLNDWPAGFGVSEVADLLKEEIKGGKVYVGTEGTFGLLPYALQVYFYKQHDIQIVGFWPVNHNDLPQQVLDAAKVQKTFFVFNENQKEITNQKLKLIATYQKGSGKSFMRLYQVLP